MNPVEIVSLHDSRGRRLRVEFFHQGDRYNHRVLLDDGRLLLNSVEGDEHASWPPSPPLQQLTVDERPHGSDVLLLVGMAGRSHWSVSVEADPSAAAIVFDVACRIVGECGPLGSQYRCDLPPHDTGDSDTIEFGVDDQTCQLVPLPPGNQTAAKIESAGPMLILVAPPATDEPPTTIRWKYRIEIS